MLTKQEIEEIISEDLKKILLNDIVYKYASYDIGIDKIIIENTLNFSHPSVFNDPFDCNEKLLKIALTLEEKKCLFDTYKTKVPKSYWNTFWDELNDPKKAEAFNKEQKDKSKISCFSANYDEVLMWSHYGNKHSGICIGFDFPHNYSEKFILAPVKYVDKLKPLDGNTSLNRLILYWLTTKSIRWEYEEEIRAIAKSNNNKNMELIEFDSKFIKQIIFGCNVNQSDIDKAIKKIGKSKLNLDTVSIKQMIIDTETFLLKEKLIKPSA